MGGRDAVAGMLSSGYPGGEYLPHYCAERDEDQQVVMLGYGGTAPTDLFITWAGDSGKLGTVGRWRWRERTLIL